MSDREDADGGRDGETGDGSAADESDVAESEDGDAGRETTAADATTGDAATGETDVRSDEVADAPGRSDAGVERDRTPAAEGAVAADAADGAAGGVLADEPLGESRRLDGRVRYQWLLGSLFGAVATAAAVAVFFQFVARRAGYPVGGTLPFGFGREAVLVGLGAFAFFVGLAVLRAVLLYRSWRYEVREDSLYLTRGVLTRVQTVAPYVRVQHVDTTRSPFERLLGLSSLVVYTAGSRGADVTIPGLTDERAAELQTRLKRLAIASEEDDAV